MSLDARIDDFSSAKRALLEERLKGHVSRQITERIPEQPRTGELELSYAQQRLWFLDQLEGAGSEYNVSRAVRVRGSLDREFLERAITEVVARHETLRTTFATIDGRPVQVIAPPAPVTMELVALDHLDEDKREPEAQALATAEAARPFDLAAGPLLRARLLRLTPEDHVLLLTMHHIVSDGWSIGLLTRELGVIYDAYRDGRTPELEPLPIQYPDFAAWQRQWLSGDVLDDQLAYWRDQLAGLAPVLELPTDHPRPAKRTTRGATQSFTLDTDTLAALSELSRAHNATLFMTLLAAFQVLLTRYSGQDDIAVGTPIAGRTRPELEDLVGFFVNTLVLRTDLSGDPSFTELLARVRDVTLDAYAHQDVPFEKLVEELQPPRSLSHTPLFQVMFTLDNTPAGELALGDTSVTRFPVGSHTAKFDLQFELRSSHDPLEGNLVYNSDLFEADTIARMGDHLKNLLTAIAADPDTPLSHLDLLDAPERHHLVVELNDTAADYPQDSCVHELFAAQVEKTPDAVALVCGDDELTYKELNAAANRLAHHLIALGVGPDTLVGICLERGIDMFVGLLAILKAGGAYIPLDPDYPPERVAFMLQDSAAKVLVTNSKVRDRVPHSDAALVLVDSDKDAIAACPATDPEPSATADDLAYVIYTSGSTGTPKGVAVGHGGLCNLLEGMRVVLESVPDEGVLFTTTLSFDIAGLEIYLPITGGGHVIVSSDSLDLDPRQHPAKPTILQGTPSRWKFVLDKPATTRQDLKILLGGEALPIEVARAVSAESKSWNVYGPTETTIWSSAFPLDSPLAGNTVPIGRPIANTQIYLLDSYLNPVPTGVPGELYIGGAGLARGYLNRPSLTAERFVPDRFATTPGARLYRTGDLARYLADGNIEFLGRVDHQLKIRGFRIEPGEIEACLTRHPSLTDAVVVARQDGDATDKRLVAYVVANGDAPTTTELRAHLLESLPDYMVPAAFVVLEELPLTPNGKLDRAALPAPEGRPELEAAYIAPRTPTEDILAGIWSEVLGLERVGVNDNFFELGGHSLVATQVVARVRAGIGVELPLGALFESPTVAALAAAVAQSDEHPETPPITPVERTGELELSFAQQRLWFLDQLEPDSPEYNIPQALRLRGVLERDALERALSDIVARHESLRTTFATSKGRPVQVIAPPAPLHLELVDPGSLSADERDLQAARIVAAEAQRPFDLEAGPLLRATLVRLDEDDHVLVLVMHHIVSDGWSMGVFTRELTLLYDAFCDGQQSPLTELAIHYADFAAWQRRWLAGDVLNHQLAYWKDQLAGLAPVLELPTDHPRPAMRRGRGATHSFAFDPDTFAALNALSRAHNATLFMTLLAAFQLLLARYSGRSDIAVGTPIAGRTHAELEDLIGFFVNTLVLRSDVSGDPSFTDLLARVREVALSAYAHQDVPFEKLVEELQPTRSLSHTPLFQVMFTLDSAAGGELALGDASLTAFQSEFIPAKFDLHLALRSSPDGLEGALLYDADLFESATIAAMGDHLANLLSAIATYPDTPLSQLDMLAALERHHLTVELNDTAADYPQDSCVHELFSAQAAQTPDAVALVSGDDELTYNELNAAANRLAHHLRALGIGPDTLVGICLERGLDLVVGLLAILKAGGAYVPLDPDYPPERVAFMLKDAGCEVVVTNSELSARIPEDAALVLTDADKVAIAAHPATDPEPTASPDDLAYVIYTSGSTGTPKGVAVGHRGVCNRLLWMQREYDIGATDVVLQKTPFSFDVSVWEFFWTLMTGARLVMARPGGHKDPAYLADTIAAHDVSVIHFVPSMLAAYLAGAPQGPLPRHTFCSGEALAPELARGYNERFEGHLHNLYGPTEASVDVTFYYCEGDPDTTVPIGRPIANTQIYLLDAHHNPVPIGVPGELYIGGAGVARGYLNRAALTAECFIPDPFSDAPGARLYRTGDLARYRPDGNIEFLGRVDHQVKIRGFRIEPGEIEAALLRHDAITDAVVIARSDGDKKDKRLVAYVANREAPTTTELRAHLLESLPEHMVPAAFVTLEALPLTSNGKLDRAALPAPEGRPEFEAAYVAPRTATEEILAGIWSEVLGLERVGVHDNFFELGGDSILSIQIIARAHQAGLGLTPKQLFQHQSVAALAAVAGQRAAVVAEQGAVTGDVPLTPIHRWFFELDLPESHHFNQARLVTADDCDPALVKEALGALVAHHDALRLRYQSSDKGWTQANAPAEDHDFFSVVDLSELDAAAQSRALKDTTTELQASLDLSHGPLIRACYFDLGPRGARLFICVHHLAVDGVSWRILLEDLETAYVQLARGDAVALAPKTTSFQQWAERLVAYAASPEALGELEHWASLSEVAFELPVDHERGPNDAASAAAVTAALSEADTDALLRAVPAAYRTQINDVLLAALTEAMAKWTGEPRVLIDLEGHGREELFEDVDVTRTVGWFTSLFPVALELSGNDKGALIKGIKEQLRAVPTRGLGYGVLAYLGADDVKERLAAPAPVSFNYLGRFGQESGTRTFAPASEATGPARAAAGERAHVIDVNGAIENGRLQMTWSYSTNLHERATIAGVAKDFMAALRALIAHCTEPGAGGVTPSDSPLAALGQPTLDQLWAEGLIDQDTEDVYPLTSTQQGMVFHTLYEPDSAVYFEQFTLTLEGELDVDVLQRAWRQTTARHAVLRSAVLWERVDEPVQVVRRAVEAPFEYHDLSALSADERDAAVTELLAADRARGFELSTAPLQRVAMVRLDARRHVVVWSFHHLLLDGWSAALLRAEILARYHALTRGEELKLTPARPYRDYVAWLQGRDATADETYWRETLAGLAAPTPLIDDGDTGEDGSERHFVELDPEVAAALWALTRSERVTLNTIIQGAWAVLLSRYSGERDVVFGATVAGRPPELAGVQDMVGLFINTVPVRVDASGDVPTGEWLADLQNDQAQQRPFEHAALTDIHAWSEVPGGVPLFDSILVFENYPTASRGHEVESQVTVSGMGAVERTNYPLNLVVTPRESIPLIIAYERSRFLPATIARMGDHLANLLSAIAAAPDTPLFELTMLDKNERYHLTIELNDTAADYPKDACVHELFAAQVKKAPDALALICGDDELTYQELNAAANRLAHHLMSLGVAPETKVGICLPRGIDMVVGLLAILKAGGTYVPLDPDYPAERVAFMVKDAGCEVLVTSRLLRESVPGSGAALVCVDSDEDLIAACPATDPEPRATPDDLAYVIYTSGSTGTPKGVAVAHGALGMHCVTAAEHHELTASDRVLVFGSFSFDVSLEQTLSPLVRGASIVLRGESWDPQTLVANVRRYGLTMLNPPTAFWHEMAADRDVVERLVASPSLRLIVTGGETMVAQRLRHWFEAGGERLPLLNNYGPTEATITTTSYRVEGVGPLPVGTVPIGRPLANTTVYLLDRYCNPVPIGVPGELYIGGAGLARGYLNRHALTAQRFVPDPFSTTPGARLYRTGDRARYLADGNIEFLGRVDDQVKIRGFRIEPGEIEAALARHDGINDAVVMARQDGDATDKRLVAYVVASNGAAPTTTELRAHLLESLPEHMVPAAFVALDELPLTPNGKLDRAALPAPEGRPELEAAYVAPRTPTEEIVASIWGEVLGVERVGINDNFFELGGHSLVATQVVARVRAGLGVELPLRALFESPTVSALAAALAQSDEHPEAPPITPVDRTGELELSFAQQRLWFLDQLEPDSAQYNVPHALRVRGVLQRDALERALSELVARHESLRTTFAAVDGRPVQVIAAPAPLECELVDLAALLEDEREPEARRIACAQAQRPFDLKAGPLLRATLLRLDDNDHVLVMVMHHIVSDGWSLALFTRELSALYAAYSNGRTPQPEPLAIQYADYAAWQRRWLHGDVLDDQVAYWKDQLAGLAPVLELPTDHPRPAVRRGRGATHAFALDPDTFAALRALSQAHNATLFMTLLSAFKLLLSRYSGSHDIAVGTPIAGRTHAELEDLIGFFVNTLVLRTDVSGDPSFVELLARVRDVALGAYAHQDVPFEKLVEELQPARSLSHTPLFQVMFTLDRVGHELTLGDASATSFPVRFRSAKFDLTLSVVEDETSAGAVIGYDADLFEPDTIAAMGDHLANLLSAIAAAPDTPLSRLDMLAAPERHHLTVELNDTATDYPKDSCVHELFAAQAAQTPDAPALTCGDTELTYNELNAAANRLAHHLISFGVGPDTLVGICLERSIDMVVGLLAILKAGGAYVPLDPDYPQERLAFMLQDTGAQVLVTNSEPLASLPELDAAVVLVDSDKDAIAARPDTDPELTAAPDDLAYVIYTSGSTGTPKGVAVGHGAIARLVCNTDYVDISPQDVFLQFAPVSFDASTFEIWAPLLNGARVAIADPDDLSPQELGRTLERHGVTVLWLTAALFNVMVETDPQSLAGVRQLLAGGEALSPGHITRALAHLPHTRLINGYGPTESTTFTCCYPISELDAGASSVPIGRPIANTQIYLLDAHHNPVPLGVPGELYIGGAGVARGYLNRAALTAQRFVPDPFSATPGARLYRTGDLARYRADGNIEFLGRVDRQVKIRGFRIEPGEIEAALLRHHVLTDAVVVARQDGDATDKRLVAYVVANGDAPTTTELRAHLLETLPEHMVPAAFVALDALPLTPNGKLDRAALPAPEGRPELEAAYLAPRTPTEEIIAGIWSEVLGVERVGINDNFFELGGHSLVATQVVARVRAGLGVELPLMTLFESPTVAALADRVEGLVVKEIEQMTVEEVEEALQRASGSEEGVA